VYGCFKDMVDIADGSLEKARGGQLADPGYERVEGDAMANRRALDEAELLRVTKDNPVIFLQSNFPRHRIKGYPTSEGNVNTKEGL
jgi:hypothetical protein